MTKKKVVVMVICYFLALLYAISIFYYLGDAALEALPNVNMLFSIMFLILFIGAVALAVGVRWGRSVLVYGNIAFFISGMWLLMLVPNLVQLSPFNETLFFRSVLMGGLFFAIVVAAYFVQNQIKLVINPDWKFERKSILVIDDDEGIQVTLKRILLDRGYSVLSALNGERGIQIAATQQPDLILLDVILPGMKGRSVCVKLKEDERTKKIPVVFLTAKDSQDDIQAEIEAGGIGHMTKPVKARILLAEIKRILG